MLTLLATQSPRDIADLYPDTRIHVRLTADARHRWRNVTWDFERDGTVDETWEVLPDGSVEKSEGSRNGDQARIYVHSPHQRYWQPKP